MTAVIGMLNIIIMKMKISILLPAYVILMKKLLKQP